MREKAAHEWGTQITAGPPAKSSGVAVVVSQVPKPGTWGTRGLWFDRPLEKQKQKATAGPSLRLKNGYVQDDTVWGNEGNRSG
jgi:hypothetical protein